MSTPVTCPFCGQVNAEVLAGAAHLRLRCKRGSCRRWFVWSPWTTGATQDPTQQDRPGHARVPERRG